MNDSGHATGRARLKLLGAFDLESDGEHVEVPLGTQRLICFLAFQGGRHVRRSYVSGSLWPDAEEPRAQASLRSTLWRVPICGKLPIVSATSTDLWLSPELEVDLTLATDRGRQLLDLHSTDPNRIDPMAELGAFTSDVLVGWYDDWLDVERERFRQLRLHVLDELGELLLRAGRYADAVEVGLAALAADSLRESAHRLLVRAHLSEGNLSEAMRQYRICASVLGRELGVRPSAAMEQLISEALATNASPRAMHRRTA